MGSGLHEAFKLLLGPLKEAGWGSRNRWGSFLGSATRQAEAGVLPEEPQQGGVAGQMTDGKWEGQLGSRLLPDRCEEGGHAQVSMASGQGGNRGEDGQGYF